MTRIKLGLGLGVLAALLLSTIAVAASHNGSAKVEAVSATFQGTLQSSHDRTCKTAENHTIRIAHETYTGTASGDARLTGNITVKSKSVTDLDTGLGSSQGKVKLENAATNAKADLHFIGATEAGTGILHGTLWGRVRGVGGQNPLPGGSLVASFQSTPTSQTTFTGELGSTGNNLDPAVLISGTCKGKGPKPKKKK